MRKSTDVLGRLIWYSRMWLLNRYTNEYDFNVWTEVYGLHLKRWKQYRDKKTNRYVPEPLPPVEEYMLRYSCGINWPVKRHGPVIHGTYYGALGQIWIDIDSDRSERTAAADFLEKELKEFFIDYFDFDEDELWFKAAVVGIEPWTQVELDDKLLNKYEMRIEDEDGETVKHYKGRYE